MASISSTEARTAMRDEIAHHRGWFVFLGVLLIIAGVAAILFPPAGSLAVEVWVGAIFVLAGIAQLAHAFAVRRWSGVAWSVLLGLLYLGAGVILLAYPIAGVVTLTVFLAAVLLIDGLFRTIMAIGIRPRRRWGWLLASGIASIVLAVLIWLQLPSSASWVLGVLLGVNLIFSGASFLGLAADRSGETRVN